MKNDKSTEKSDKKKMDSGSNGAGNKRSRTGMTDSGSAPNATARTKPKSGKGLANEGTIVSYDEER